MAAQVLIAHTGQRLEIDTSRLESLDDFKLAVSRQTSIPPNCIIALVPPGKALKPQALQTEKEIFVYDSRVTQASSPTASLPAQLELAPPKPYAISKPPNDIHDTHSLQSWQDLFRDRRAWALQVAQDCDEMARTAQGSYEQVDVILTCLDAAVANLEAVVRATESKYDELKKWLAPEQAEFNVLVTSWEQYLSLARSVPVSASMVRLMTGKDVTGAKGRPSKQATLEDLVDLDVARREGRRAPAVLRKFTTKAADLEKAASRLIQNFDEIVHQFEQAAKRSALSHADEPAQLLQDIGALVNKIETDYHTTLEYSSSTRDLLQASKIAATHTERLLPSIRSRALEMDKMVRDATQARNALAAESLDFMRSITEMTSLTTQVKAQINSVGQDEELSTFDYLRLIQQVPYVYASFVAESIRRREWYEKIRTDSATLANEMALFQDEEIKRRRKWFKSIGETNYGPEALGAESNVPGLEVNLLGEDEQWPAMSRKELEEFHDTLQRQRAEAEIMADIAKLIGELNSPTKQQFKRLKAFKNGSVHEAALGRSGLMIRGDDEVLRSLQEDKLKLETKLKTAESRVRRLEDLLHRQSQASRPTLGNMFQTPSQQLPDRNDSTASIRSPALSVDRRQSVDNHDIQIFQRIKQLETELNSEKERAAVLERDAAARATQHDDIKSQMDEVNSTKKDLLENMEALKREFMDERKSLEEEIRKLQARLEYTEDEIEHFDESRENEKASYDDKVRSLEAEVERLAKEKTDDALKAQGQVDFLRNEARLQRERNEALQAQLQSSQDDVNSLTRKLKQSDEVGEVPMRALRDLHQQYLPETSLPSDINDLADAVSNKLADILAKVRTVESDMVILRSDLELAQNAARELKSTLLETQEKLSNEEMTSLRLKEQSLEQKARVSALEGELEDGRKQLDELRVRLAHGETGSESLRVQLEEEDKKIMTLTEDLASKQSQVGSLEEELRLFQEKLQVSQSKLGLLGKRSDARTERAKDLSQRLYSQNERLVRLLERLGFSVSREGGSMAIQKIPRAERSTMILNEGETRSGAASRVLAEQPGDIELLYWMHASGLEEEAEKYEAYMSSLGSFDMDAFSETLYRRVKDVEHVARKMQRDLRSCREKMHMLQKDAHDKIAFKHFKEGDLALFLPTRNQTNGAWAAFNIGFPHYFLREQEAHRLRNREWLVARITRVQEKVVDLSKSLQGETESLNEDDNPFDLSDGLRWYMIDAVEDKPGDVHMHPRSGKALSPLGGRPTGIDGVSKTLSKSLESRRSSTSSKRAPSALAGPSGIRNGTGSHNNPSSETNSLRATADASATASPSQQQAQLNSPAQSPGKVPPVDAETPHAPRHNYHNHVYSAQAQPPPQQHGRVPPPVQREHSAASVESPAKRSVVWDHLWNLDFGYDGGM
ncbi:hypothetical protein RB601_001577 [Gaeumannomyces tritici]